MQRSRLCVCAFMVFLACSLGTSAAFEISVTDPSGKEIEGSQACVILKSGAYQKGEKQKSLFLFEPFEGQGQIYLAAPGFESDSKSITSGQKRTFVLKPSSNRNSKIIYGRGDLEGKGGDINPILDSSNRLYVYASGIGLLDGNKPANQPLPFKVRVPISAEDSTGKPFKIYVMDISQRVSLVEYTK